MTRIEPKEFIQLDDIQTNPEHWTQKINIIEFRDKKGKIYWNKDYNFIPKWKGYKEAKDWIKNTEFPEYDCKVVWNDNNGIEVVTQNFFGTIVAHEQAITWIIRKIKQKIIKEINDKLDFDKEEDLLIKEDLDKILAFKTYQEFKDGPYAYIYEEHLEDLKQAESRKGKLSGKDLEKQAYDLNRNDLAILWRKQLYFIDGYKYIDNYNLFVQFTAFKCPLAISYPTWLTTQGVGVLESGPVIKTTSDNFEDNQRMHYDFCQDLGIKKIEQQAFSYQPNFQLFRAIYQTLTNVDMLTAVREITWSDQCAIGQGEPKQLSIPSDIKLKKFRKEDFPSLAQNWAKSTALSIIFKLRSIADQQGAYRQLAQQIMDSTIHLTIGPGEMDPNEGCFFSKVEDKEEILFPKNPTFARWFEQQPHLWDHATFQFYLFNEITMTANGRFIGIKPRCANCNNLIGEERSNKPKCSCSSERRRIKEFVLPYKLFINYSVFNLDYRWEFEYITVKCGIDNKGVFEDWTNPARTMTGFNFKAGGRIAATGASVAFGSSWSESGTSGSRKGKNKKKSSPTAEAQTDRMFRSTFKDALDRSVEPAMFNANTINFNFSLGEFFNRLTDPVFFYRVDISELLYNNLSWANNKSTYLGLPFQWKELGSWTQQEGFYKWKNVYLENDYQGFWKNIMEKGYLLTDGEDHTKNPKLNFAHANSHIQTGGNAWNISVAEEEIIETKIEEEYEERLPGGDHKVIDAHASFITYFRVPNHDLYAEISCRLSGHQTGIGRTVRQVNYAPNNNSMDSINVFCWGCVIATVEIPISHGGIIYTFFNQDQGTEKTMEIPDNCTLIIDPPKGEFRVRGKRTNTGYEVKPRQIRQTVNQEIDQDLLESETIEETMETIEQEDASEILKEVGANQEKETIEPEKEKEPWETEREKESEKEDEKEKEKETETEKEKEREKESEQEKLERERLEREESEKEQERKEKEKEDEDE